MKKLLDRLTELDYSVEIDIEGFVFSRNNQVVVIYSFDDDYLWFEQSISAYDINIVIEFYQKVLNL